MLSCEEAKRGVGLARMRLSLVAFQDDSGALEIAVHWHSSYYCKA